jgi:hypothetical protein
MTAAREGEGFLVASGLSFFPLAFSFFFSSSEEGSGGPDAVSLAPLSS